MFCHLFSMYSVVVHSMSLGSSKSRSVNNCSKGGWRYIYISYDVNFGNEGMVKVYGKWGRQYISFLLTNFYILYQWIF
jgi:hypothetical protein